MDKRESAIVRQYVMDYYRDRGGRNVRIGEDGSVSILVDGNGSQMVKGRDISGGRIFAGYAPDLLREATR